MSNTRREDARRARTQRYSRMGATALALSLMISGPVASASADTVPEEPVQQGSMTILVEVPPREDIPTATPTPTPSSTADAGQSGGGGLAGTGMDGGLLALLVALGVVAVGSGTVIASRRRAQRG